MSEARRHEVCAVALAELFRGDGAILASPMGTLPSIGARLARRTFAPDLLLADGKAAALIDADGHVEGALPYRKVFEIVWSGKRHVVMGASQIDRHGNQNISAIGAWAKPKVQLLGMRGAPGNTINHTTSYWVAKHAPRVFVPRVDVVSGVGHDRAAELGEVAARFHDVRAVVSNLGVFDFRTPARTMRVASLHPGVTLDEVTAATGFELEVARDARGEIPVTRTPTAEELRLLRTEIDPDGRGAKEVPS